MENLDWDDDGKKIIVSSNIFELGVLIRIVDKVEFGLNEVRFDILEEKFVKEEISEKKKFRKKKKKKYRNMEEWWKEEEY